MFPNLSYFFNYLLGTPADNFLSIFQTFGLFLVLAFVASAYFFKKELVRKRKLGLFEGKTKIITNAPKSTSLEIILNAIFGFIAGFKIPVIVTNSLEFSQDPTGLLMSLKGNLIIGIIAAIIFGGTTYILSNRKKSTQPTEETVTVFPEDQVMEITIIAAFFGILGSKLFSVFENWESFIQAPIRTFFSGSGLTIYGGLILASLAVLYYVKRMGMKPLHIMDATAPALIVGYAVGRMGCHFAGDGDWGIINDSPKPNWFIFPDWAWAYDYPHNVVNDLREGVLMENCGGVTAVGGIDPIYCTKLAQNVFPTPLYEIFAGLLILGILWFLRTRLHKAGMLFFIYVLLNGIERFFIEQIRVNPKYELFGLNWSLSQWIAFGLIALGLFGIFYLYKFGKLKATKP